MCGIIGYVGDENKPRTVEVLTQGLSKLEYRGYDSAGIVVDDQNKELKVIKRAAVLDELEEVINETEFTNPSLGMGHTRWSTHGPPNHANAHPQTGCTNEIAVVHNGIIENYEEHRTDLENTGHEFTSDTDTEVIPHLIEKHLEECNDPRKAFSETIDELEGSFAIVAMFANQNKLFGTRQESPLVLGLGDGENFLGSDVPAFLDFTDKVVYLEDGEIVELSNTEFTVFGTDGEIKSKVVETVEWDKEEAQKEEYEHYMLKEIHEIPRAVRQCLSGRLQPELSTLRSKVFEQIPEGSGFESVEFVGCGTSYNAAIYGQTVFRKEGLPARASFAGEFDPEEYHLSDETLVIAITQSGETADTLQALRNANDAGYETLTVTNVVGSTAARIADHCFYTRAGPEIGVVATKTFSTQLTSLFLLSKWFGYTRQKEHHHRTDKKLGTNKDKEISEVLLSLEKNESDAEHIDAVTDAIEYYTSFSNTSGFSGVDALNVRYLADHTHETEKLDGVCEDLFGLLVDYVNTVNEDIRMPLSEEVSEPLTFERILNVLNERERRFQTGLTTAFENTDNQALINELQQSYLFRIWNEIEAYGKTNQLEKLDPKSVWSVSSDVKNLPDELTNLIDRSSVEEISKYENSDELFLLGEGTNYAAARDGALKISEVAYKTAQAYTPSEMKHGPLALVTPNTPVIVIIAGESKSDTKRISGNIRELQARGAPVTVIAEEDQSVPATVGSADNIIHVPSTIPELSPIFVSTVLQLIAYYLAKSLNQSIDKPRNLAKSVTVE